MFLDIDANTETKLKITIKQLTKDILIVKNRNLQLF